MGDHMEICDRVLDDVRYKLKTGHVVPREGSPEESRRPYWSQLSPFDCVVTYFQIRNQTCTNGLCAQPFRYLNPIAW